VLRFDDFLQQTEAVKPTPWNRTGLWRDEDDLEFFSWLQENGIYPASTKAAAEVIRIESQLNRYHPILALLDDAAAAWDRKPRIDNWLTRYLGAGDGPPDYPEYFKKIGARFLLQAVARIYDPGSKADYTLVSQGGTGRYKSTCFQYLFDPWFTDKLPDIAGPEAPRLLRRVWGVEIGELDGISRREVSTVKSFLTRRTDYIRDLWGRHYYDQPRHTVFTASTNDVEFLKDVTGNRRFWIVPVIGYGNPEGLLKDRLQILGEAVMRYRQRERYWIDERIEPELAQAAAAMCDERMELDIWEDAALSFIERRGRDITINEFLTGSVTDGALGKDLRDCVPNDYHRVSRILQGAGYEKYREKTGSRDKRWKKKEAENPDAPYCHNCGGHHLNECAVPDGQ
jgi:predicted P-loop ATPase